MISVNPKSTTNQPPEEQTQEQVEVVLTKRDLRLIVRALQSSIGNIALTERLNALLAESST